ncbi:MAG: hypothetical protein IJR88_05770 [Clostridia bacterium]|nr:hypothetical protein [Clostridia bacterium]
MPVLGYPFYESEVIFTIRGAQKQVIVVKTEGSRLFEEAYFILRRELPTSRPDKKAILGEAEKIFNESAPGVRPRRSFRAWIFFLFGILFGALAFFLGFLLKKGGL